jgi:hypothetical protein
MASGGLILKDDTPPAILTQIAPSYLIRHNYVPFFFKLHKYELFRLFINLITYCI